MASSWEGWGATWSADSEASFWREDDTLPENYSPADAGTELYYMRVELKLRGVLNATQICVLSVWAQ